MGSTRGRPVSHQLFVDPHCNDVPMGAIAPQITSRTIVYSVVYSDADQRKTSKLRVIGLCAGNSPGTGEFPAQMASYAENVSIWWRHHVLWPILSVCSFTVQQASTTCLQPLGLCKVQYSRFYNLYRDTENELSATHEVHTLDSNKGGGCDS